MEGKRAVVILIVVMVALGAGYFLFQTFSPELDREVPVPQVLSDSNSNMSNMEAFRLTSKAFSDGSFIPSKYTCDEQSISPPLEFFGIPEGTKSLVLVMNDPDVPKTIKPDGNFDHWILYNIPPTVELFDEGKFVGTPANNGAGKAVYAGPCPPPQYQPTTHRYFFKLYATDLETLNFIKTPTKQEVLTAIEGHIIGETQLIGKYDRTKTSREND